MLRSLALLACLTASPAAASAPPPLAQKSDLRVLLVTHDPESPRVPIPSIATDRTHELYRERGPAFEAFLREHFEHVEAVVGMDYREEMSEGVDVTVFDSPPLRTDDFGGSSGPTVRERTLNRNFSRPALMIGYASPRIGEPIGLKLDWL